MRRSSQSHQPAGVPLAHLVLDLDVAHDCPKSRRHYQFFESTSFNARLSSVSSATTCFSFRFSSSRCFSLLASPLSIPPYFAFQRSLIPCCRHNSAVVNPASPCFRIAMICSSLCRVPFMAVSPSWVYATSHSTVNTFGGIDHFACPRPPNSFSNKLFTLLFLFSVTKYHNAFVARWIA